MDIEQALAQKPLPEPTPHTRAAMLARARRERRGRMIERIWGWTLAAAATLLLVLNLHFGHVHEQRMIALAGPQGIERPVDPKVFVRQFEQRRRLLTMWLTEEFPSELKEERL